MYDIYIYIGIRIICIQVIEWSGDVPHELSEIGVCNNVLISQSSEAAAAGRSSKRDDRHFVAFCLLAPTNIVNQYLLSVYVHRYVQVQRAHTHTHHYTYYNYIIIQIVFFSRRVHPAPEPSLTIIRPLPREDAPSASA